MQELVKAGFKTTVLTRSKASLKNMPSGVNVVEVDYNSQSSLVNAVRGNEVLIATLKMDVILDVQPSLIEAAITAGVKRYIPSEYSGITLDPGSRGLPLLKGIVDQQELIKQKAAEGAFEYTIFAPGGWPNVRDHTLDCFSGTASQDLTICTDVLGRDSGFRHPYGLSLRRW